MEAWPDTGELASEFARVSVLNSRGGRRGTAWTAGFQTRHWPFTDVDCDYAPVCKIDQTTGWQRRTLLHVWVLSEIMAKS
jgi:hypothetical protein